MWSHLVITGIKELDFVACLLPENRFMCRQSSCEVSLVRWIVNNSTCIVYTKILTSHKKELQGHFGTEEIVAILHNQYFQVRKIQGNWSHEFVDWIKDVCICFVVG